jgi:hypothetical protein
MDRELKDQFETSFAGLLRRLEERFLALEAAQRANALSLTELLQSLASVRQSLSDVAVQLETSRSHPDADLTPVVMTKLGELADTINVNSQLLENFISDLQDLHALHAHEANT